MRTVLCLLSWTQLRIHGPGVYLAFIICPLLCAQGDFVISQICPGPNVRAFLPASLATA